jgi:hypothetical protein
LASAGGADADGEVASLPAPLLWAVMLARRDGTGSWLVLEPPMASSFPGPVSASTADMSGTYLCRAKPATATRNPQRKGIRNPKRWRSSGLSVSLRMVPTTAPSRTPRTTPDSTSPP